MSRVLTTTVAGTGAHRLGAAPPDQLDPVVRQLVEQASTEAYERGLRDGHDRGAAAAEVAVTGRLDQLGASIAAAVETAAQAGRAASEEALESAFELAVAIAEAIIGREPHDGGAAVAARVRDTLGRIEDPRPVVRVNAEDADLVTAALADLDAVTVAADPTLAPGEARIRGGWAEADLTQAAAFATIRRDLGVDD